MLRPFLAYVEREGMQQKANTTPGDKLSEQAGETAKGQRHSASVALGSWVYKMDHCLRPCLSKTWCFMVFHDISILINFISHPGSKSRKDLSHTSVYIGLWNGFSFYTVGLSLFHMLNFHRFLFCTPCRPIKQGTYSNIFRSYLYIFYHILYHFVTFCLCVCAPTSFENCTCYGW